MRRPRVIRSIILFHSSSIDNILILDQESFQSMSGIEVADLVLGALPILLAVIDSSKDGMRRFEGLFKRRKHIEKLVRALLLQQQVLKETVRSVVIASGYKYPHQIAHDPIHLLKDKAVQEEIFDYLGPENYAALTGTFTQSSDVVKRVAKNIAGLVGSTKVCYDSLVLQRP